MGNTKAKVLVKTQYATPEIASNNQDIIKEVNNGNETAIGVGSVVLHLRKNRHLQNAAGDIVSYKEEVE